MLTLTRSVGESIRIGEDIEVYVVEVRGGTVRLGFKAPREVTIHREEVYRQIAEANALAAQVAADVAGALATFAPAPAEDPSLTDPDATRTVAARTSAGQPGANAARPAARAATARPGAAGRAARPDQAVTKK